MEPDFRLPNPEEDPHFKEILEFLEGNFFSDFSSSLPTDWEGTAGDVARTINRIAKLRSDFSEQLIAAFDQVKEEGRLDAPIDIEIWPGKYRDIAADLNAVVENAGKHMEHVTHLLDDMANGNLIEELSSDCYGDLGVLSPSINRLIGALREAEERRKLQNSIASEIASLSYLVQTESNLEKVAEAVLTGISNVLSVDTGALYQKPIIGKGSNYSLLAQMEDMQFTSSTVRSTDLPVAIVPLTSEGEVSVICDDPANYLHFASPPIEAKPQFIARVPIVFAEETLAVLILVNDVSFTPGEIEYLKQGAPIMGLGIHNVRNINISRDALAESLELTKQLNIKARELELNSKYKTQFLSNMSHELRTPLVRLLIISELLAENPDGNLSDKEVGFAKMIHEAGTDLLNLVNDILDFSKIETGNISLNYTRVDLEELANRIYKVCFPIAVKKQLEFSVTLADDLPRSAIIDEIRVRQVVNNLLFNAIKFTKEGRISLRVEKVVSSGGDLITPAETAQSAVRFLVTDTGIGIPESDHEIIFEMFRQGDEEVSRKHGGAGLGLSISRDLAEMMGGSLILLQSAPNRGTTFEFILPMSPKVDYEI